ncbi:S-protein homolog 5-like [Lycium barbarum]|uniref:S-protein homolog 5-like n=1 Tax=Lycium barbarum TaxID=112863 RepID=UPI00293EAA80|nr:S-protein homolog 5-like [Lycium barbarum]
MVHFLVKILFLLQLFIMSHNIQGYWGCKNAYIEEHHVHVLNELPIHSPKLKLHCASGDDDLGDHWLDVGTDFDWEFCANPSTLFFCHFWWGEKNQVFDVFNDLHYCVHDGKGYVPEFTTKCHWKVQADGFYLGYLNQDAGKILYTKYRDW